LIDHAHALVRGRLPWMRDGRGLAFRPRAMAAGGIMRYATSAGGRRVLRRADGKRRRSAAHHSGSAHVRDALPTFDSKYKAASHGLGHLARSPDAGNKKLITGCARGVKSHNGQKRKMDRPMDVKSPRSSAGGRGRIRQWAQRRGPSSWMKLKRRPHYGGSSGKWERYENHRSCFSESRNGALEKN